MTAPEPAALARQWRVTLAEALEKFPEMSTHDPEKLGRMSMHTQDYSDLPDPNLPPPNWMWRVYTVVCIALFLAVLVVVGRMV